jgi:hypothetical protein
VIDETTRRVIIYLVSGVWAVNFGAGFVVEGYKPDQAINGIFMAIVGGLFALGARSDKNGKNSGGSGSGGDSGEGGG